MVKKKKTLPDNLQEIIDSKDMELFKEVFDKCEISATNRGKTTSNVFTYKNLTIEHLCFLIERGIDLNADSGFGHTPATFLADDINLLKCLIEHGADIDYDIPMSYGSRGNALFCCARSYRVQAVENLISCGANPEPRGGLYNNTALDEALQGCRGAQIVSMSLIAKMLISAGAKPSNKSSEFVKKIGEDFEFRRSDFNPKSVDEVSNALDELYRLFQVEPIPRRMVYDGKTAITVNGDTWQKQFDELWKLLVPGSGHATTVQGEVIRIIGRITYEILDNSGINWDDEYRELVDALPEYFEMFSSEITEKACSLAKRISSRSDENLLYSLTELAVKWVLDNNQPIPLNNVNYKR